MRIIYLKTSYVIVQRREPKPPAQHRFDLKTSYVIVQPADVNYSIPAKTYLKTSYVIVQLKRTR